MQTTLDVASVSEHSTIKNTMIQSEAHIMDLYLNSSAGLLQSQIEKHLAEEKKYTESLKEEDAYLQQFKEFKPKSQYIRIGKKQ